MALPPLPQVALVTTGVVYAAVNNPDQTEWAAAAVGLVTGKAKNPVGRSIDGMSAGEVGGSSGHKGNTVGSIKPWTRAIFPVNGVCGAPDQALVNGVGRSKLTEVGGMFAVNAITVRIQVVRPGQGVVAILAHVSRLTKVHIIGCPIRDIFTSVPCHSISSWVDKQPQGAGVARVACVLEIPGIPIAVLVMAVDAGNGGGWKRPAEVTPHTQTPPRGRVHTAAKVMPTGIEDVGSFEKPAGTLNQPIDVAANDIWNSSNPIVA